MWSETFSHHRSWKIFQQRKCFIFFILKNEKFKSIIIITVYHTSHLRDVKKKKKKFNVAHDLVQPVSTHPREMTPTTTRRFKSTKVCGAARWLAVIALNYVTQSRVNEQRQQSDALVVYGLREIKMQGSQPHPHLQVLVKTYARPWIFYSARRFCFIMEKLLSR